MGWPSKGVSKRNCLANNFRLLTQFRKRSIYVNRPLEIVVPLSLTFPPPMAENGWMKIWLFISHLGVGLLPGPTGTWGAALGVVLFALLNLAFPFWGGVGLLVVSALLGTVAAHQAEKVWGHDAGQIIVDEVAGQAVTLLFVPLSPFTLILGFFLFRFFDILKCPPMSWAERIPGGAGVMADDLLAGVYAGCFLWMAWGLKGIFWAG